MVFYQIYVFLVEEICNGISGFDLSDNLNYGNRYENFEGYERIGVV